MTFEEYQSKAKTTAVYPKIADEFIYPVLGLAGEAGELANKIKKIYRDHDGNIAEDYRKEIAKELGDVLWYVSQIATEFGLSLQDDVAHGNLSKLASRFERDTLAGEGDNR